MGIAKQIKTLCFQLGTFVGENQDFQRKASIIEQEFELCKNSSKVIRKLTELYLTEFCTLLGLLIAD